MLLVKLEGRWSIHAPLPPIASLIPDIETHPGVREITIDTSGIEDWDTSLLPVIMAVENHCQEKKVMVSRSEWPEGLQRLVALAKAVPPKPAGPVVGELGMIEGFGQWGMRQWRAFMENLEFIGLAAMAVWRFVTGRSSVRRRDFLTILQECGASTLPIVSLIAALFGLILAFVGAVQLVMFGAEIFVASLVCIAIVRVMGAVIVGIIVAGRTGAAFAAQIGTMQVNEELDALQTFGVKPMEFLVAPRIVCLALMMPPLCLYAELMGILGGLLVGVGMLDLSVIEYYNQTKESFRMQDFAIGLFHSFVFGVLIALTGCYQGIKCGRSASAVGQATTQAVVNGIVAIVVATAVITYLCNVLKI